MDDERLRSLLSACSSRSAAWACTTHYGSHVLYQCARDAGAEEFEYDLFIAIGAWPEHVVRLGKLKVVKCQMYVGKEPPAAFPDPKTLWIAKFVSTPDGATRLQFSKGREDSAPAQRVAHICALVRVDTATGGMTELLYRLATQAHVLGTVQFAAPGGPAARPVPLPLVEPALAELFALGLRGDRATLRVWASQTAYAAAAEVAKQVLGVLEGAPTTSETPRE